jgi:hypothetical protein
MFIEPYAGAGLGHDRCERGLAKLKQIAPQVVAVQFDQVERRRGFSSSRFRVDANSERASYFPLRIGGQSEELAMTKILATVIGVGGVAMIALGLWGFYVLMVGELRLREYILAIQTIAVGFVLIGLAQGLRLLLALVALQPGH